jgi:hypothetical protein
VGRRPNSALVWRAPIIARSDLSWVILIVGGIAFLFGVALLIGVVLAALPFIFGAVLAFAAVVLVFALTVSELPRFWARLPR